MRLHFVVLSFLAVSQLAAAQGADARPQRSQTVDVRAVLAHALPVLDGKRLRVEVVEVTFAPGASSPPHRHPCAAIVYVAAGSIRSKSGSEREATYGAGESFYEAPNALHATATSARTRYLDKGLFFGSMVSSDSRQ